jgi:hypothetical protein
VPRQELKESVELLGETPAAILRLVEGLPPSALRRKPSADEFSFVEHACHLRDIETEGYNVRLRKFLSEARPTFEDIDGARLARERLYNEQDFQSALDAFARARRESLALLENLPEEAHARTASFEGAGEVSVSRLVSMMCEHDLAHREEMAALRESLLGRTAGAR